MKFFFQKSIPSYSYNKIFCIGFNKTGTTSLRHALKEFGFTIGNQRKAELLICDWAKRDFRRIIRYCHSAQAFQDIPFSLPYTFQALDVAFTSSKFILTIRENPMQWYKSLTTSHAKKYGNGKIPDKNMLQSAHYIYKGFPWESFRLVYNTPDENPYKQDILIKLYEDHIKTVKDYFKYRENDLLAINIAKQESYSRLCEFLKVAPRRNSFPWLNKT